MPALVENSHLSLVLRFRHSKLSRGTSEEWSSLSSVICIEDRQNLDADKMAQQSKNQEKVQDRHDIADPALIALVKYLARRAAERDYEATQLQSVKPAEAHSGKEAD
ncbi:MAG: hypothetical protein RIC85_04145 [Gammaproteobacteria bacterium]